MSVEQTPFSERVALVTGANRGVGMAITNALLRRGVKKVYAIARHTDNLETIADDRLVPVSLDITNHSQIDNLGKQATDLDLLINNAGVNGRGNLLTVDINIVRWEMDVNYYGTLNMIRALAPIIEANGGGNIVNMISICALASMPGLGGYSASKAALFSATQALRHTLKQKNILVQGVIPGPIDTMMNDGLDIEMATPGSVANAILDGILSEDEEIFPDPIGLQSWQVWFDNPKKLEKEFSPY